MVERDTRSASRVWLNLEGVQSTGEPFAIIPKYFATFNEHVSALIPESANVFWTWAAAPVYS